MTFLLPAGATAEPADRQGLGALISEMIFRGAADLDARAHANALDMLGVNRSAEVHTWFFRIGATFLGDRIDRVLPLLTDMVRHPHLKKKDLGPAVDLAVQEIESLEDEPQEKVMIALKKRHLGEPLGRSTLGLVEHLRSTRIADVRDYTQNRFVPGGAILALAGAVDFTDVRDRVARLLGDMTGEAQIAFADAAPIPSLAYEHVHADSTQQHIGLAYETVGERDASCTLQRLATSVLSGGMSGRLFTHIREERGLCYSVYATYAARRTSGTVFAYAGTTTQRAAETLEMLSAELRRLGDGIEPDEFHRAVVGIKAHLVMQGESTSARARAIAYDQFLLGHPRTLDERASEFDAVTLDHLNEFVASHRPEAFTTVSIGPQPLGRQNPASAA